MDITTLDFDSWLSVVFERPELHVDAEVGSSAVIVEYMTKLFREFGTISGYFSMDEIDRAIWFLLGGGQIEAAQHLADRSVPIERRTDCIRAMYHVYSDFADTSTEIPLPAAFHMWFDLVCSAVWRAFGGRPYFELALVDRAVIDAVFETLERLLAHAGRVAEEAALHGLGHVHHPDSPKLVQQYIDRNRHDLSPEGLLWLEQCRDGTVM